MREKIAKSAQRKGTRTCSRINKIALLSYVCLVSTVFFLLSLCPASNIYGKEVLRVGVYNNKPTIFEDNGGKAKGLFIDILEEIGINEGWEL